MRFGIVAVTALAGLPLAAHHSFAGTYDESKPVTLEGTVSKVLFRNPHSFFLLDVTDADGKASSRNIELQGAGALFSNGWTKSSLKDGDRVIVIGVEGRNSSEKRAAAFTVTLADGTVLKSNPRWGMVKP
jgi:hypothetical protein